MVVSVVPAGLRSACALGEVLRLAGANHRVPGLRWEEVAVLAGISVGYCRRLERDHVSLGFRRWRPGHSPLPARPV
jgi:hypothetical protein